MTGTMRRNHDFDLSGSIVALGALAVETAVTGENGSAASWFRLEPRRERARVEEGICSG